MVAEKKLAGAKAIVTGAAQGIGEAVARIFAREGASVVIADINLPGAKKVASEIEASGGSALAIKVDVTQSKEVAKMVEELLGRWKAIDILVNNAGGFYQFAPIGEVTEEQWDMVITLNLKSVFLCSKAVANHMKERQKGRIINIASKAGVHPNWATPSYLPYGTAKGGVIVFTKYLASELAPHGVTVNAISPNTARTPRLEKLRGEEGLKKVAETNPMRHLVEPKDVAEAALFLASEAGRYITGINLNVNAGALLL